MSRHVDSPAASGERLRAARVAAGLSQRKLAFDGCSPAYISRLESGDRIASLQVLRELGRRLGVSADYLATGDDGLEGHARRVADAFDAWLDVLNNGRLDDAGLERRDEAWYTLTGAVRQLREALPCASGHGKAPQG